MHLIETLLFFPYRNGLRRMAPQRKAALSAAFLAAAMAYPRMEVLGAVTAGATAVVCLGAGLPVRRWAGLLGTPLAFSGFAVAPMVAAGRWEEAMEVCARVVGATSAVAMFGVTTPVPDLVAVAQRVTGMGTLAEIGLVTYRAIAQVGLSAMRLRRGLALRGLGTRWSRAAAVNGLFAAALGERSLEQAVRSERGLAVRGLEGRLRVLPPAGRGGC
jgi:cobalt/nickel transport system permease protein